MSLTEEQIEWVGDGLRWLGKDQSIESKQFFSALSAWVKHHDENVVMIELGEAAQYKRVLLYPETVA